MLRGFLHVALIHGSLRSYTSVAVQFILLSVSCIS